MKLSLLIISVLLATSFADEFQEEDDVLVLTKDNFDEALDEFKFIMVEFYAPWCGHCKKLAPEYSAAAKELKAGGGSNYVRFAKVDATVESTLAEKFGVQGFPTLKFFINGSPIDYEGARQQADLIGWVLKKSGPPSIELKSLDELSAYIEKTTTVPLVVYFGEEDSDFLTFKTVAQLNDKVLFLHIFDSAARTVHNVESGVKVVLFKSFDEKRDDFTNEFTQQNLEGFINANSNPILLPFNDKAISVIFQARNNAIFLFTDDSETGTQAYDAFASIAGKYKDKLKFSFSKANDGFGLFHRLAEYIGASTTQIPNIMLFDQASGNAKYLFNGEFTSENIDKFVDDFLNHKLTRYLKSEDIPSSNDGPVKVVVGKQFDELVINNDKDVLVEFYAPWCGHCKELAPIYEEVAKKLSVNSNIVIAKVDATANEVVQVSVESFPTLKFFKNGQKNSIIHYNSGRDEASLIQFLKDNTSHPWIDLEKGEDL